MHQKKLLSALPLLVLIFLIAVSGISESSKLEDSRASALSQTIMHLPLPKTADFAGESLPLHNFDVRESLQREMTLVSYWHSSMLYTMQLANRFFPVIEPILKEEGIPTDFKYLCVAESNLQQVKSPSKAVGFWQFLENTAKEYKLEITSEVDERYNIEKATKAACAYLKKSYEKYGSWTLAAAAYNVGVTNINNYIAQQHQISYYDLLLPDETSRYIYRIVAFKLVMSNPSSYGFQIAESDTFAPLQWDEIKITGAVESWATFAVEHGTNYKIFKYFNPWLRDQGLANKAGKTYYVKIPRKGFREQAYAKK